ncbi:hypothetical protein DFP94_101251 [Fontibacillus phaseoli]|uniref:Uncharacterized protein n=1 Tax=Fontibacillus phaseoli TaxID=1416533 RepID=A0A369BMP4_9BACL|nr:hypothetical protein DFP94_101251 [Fontibacillus phaseoli]
MNWKKSKETDDFASTRPEIWFLIGFYPFQGCLASPSGRKTLLRYPILGKAFSLLRRKPITMVSRSLFYSNIKQSGRIRRRFHPLEVGIAGDIPEPAP